MDFDLDADQRELQSTARDIIDKECSPAFLRSVIDDGADPAAWWSTMVELYWPAIAIAEDHGGLGMGWVELGILAEELGRAADPSPFLATTTQFAPAIEHVGDAAQAARWLSGVASGSITGALALGTAGVTATPVGDSWRLDGSVRHVLDGDRADEIVVVASAPDGSAAFVVERASAGLTAERTPAFDHSVHVADLAFDGVVVPADRELAGDRSPDALEQIVDEATLGVAASTVGACQRILDLTVDYVKERHQFGVPIGSFQAVKHKAVDMYVAVERARAVVQYAAQLVAADAPRRGTVVAMAKAAAGECQALVVRHGIQLFGGIGFTWENDLQMFVRRAKLCEMFFGNAVHHRQVVAQAAPGAVQLEMPAEVDAVRAEFGAWLDANLPDPAGCRPRSGSSADVPPWAREFQAAMFDAGWLLPGQPPEFGGRNAPLLAQFAVQDTMTQRRIYRSFNPQGLGIIAPSILMFGTDEQKRTWAVPILRAEMTAALGMSEPNAGSDLAGLRTRAVLDGDRFVVNGQKVWTSGAHDADVILLFVRTDPDAPKHKGISVLVVPTDLPGITRRPFGSISDPDDLDFNEVFFDDVEVPAANLIGELNNGWRVATGALGEERAMLWLSQFERIDDLIRDVRREVAGTDILDDPVTQDWFGKVVIDAAALQLLGYRTVAASAQGRVSAQQSILKLLGSEASQEASRLALETLGPDYALDRTRKSSPYNPYLADIFTEGWFHRYIRSFAMTIAGGTSEIQRNIVGEMVLGLPR